MSEPESPAGAPSIDYQRLYRFRFRDIDQGARQAVWNEIARQVYRWMGSPQRVLDPAAGRGEFVNAIPAPERWVVDSIEHDETFLDRDVKLLLGDARTIPLPDEHFDGVFVSNLLEHFASQEDVGAFLLRAHRAMARGGRIAILGPNFRYCSREYFDCADHTLALTHRAVEEHLYTAGFEIERVIPRYLPYSFRSRFPRAPWLVRAYLNIPLAWRVFGKQFLVIAVAPE
jgi:ubiquinone/menaquinone biosynthesis C-methylase UbiE